MGYYTQRVVSARQKLVVTGCTPKATEGPQITQQVNKCFLWLQTKNYTVHPTHPPCTDALLTLVFMWISVGLASPGHMRPLSVITGGRHGRGRKEQSYYCGWAALVWGLLLRRVFVRYGNISLILSQALRVAELFGD